MHPEQQNPDLLAPSFFLGTELRESVRMDSNESEQGAALPDNPAELRFLLKVVSKFVDDRAQELYWRKYQSRALVLIFDRAKAELSKAIADMLLHDQEYARRSLDIIWKIAEAKKLTPLARKARANSRSMERTLSAQQREFGKLKTAYTKLNPSERKDFEAELADGPLKTVLDNLKRLDDDVPVTTEYKLNFIVAALKNDLSNVAESIPLNLDHHVPYPKELLNYVKRNELPEALTTRLSKLHESRVHRMTLGANDRLALPWELSIVETTRTGEKVKYPMMTEDDLQLERDYWAAELELNQFEDKQLDAYRSLRQDVLKNLGTKCEQKTEVDDFEEVFNDLWAKEGKKPTQDRVARLVSIKNYGDDSASESIRQKAIRARNKRQIQFG